MEAIVAGTKAKSNARDLMYNSLIPASKHGKKRSVLCGVALKQRKMLAWQAKHPDLCLHTPAMVTYQSQLVLFLGSLLVFENPII